MKELRTKLSDEAKLKITAPNVLSEGVADMGMSDVAFPTPVAEAIIVVDRDLRPALIVRNNSFEEPSLTTWKTALNAQRTTLEHALLSVGRLELINHPTLPYGGTAWMIGDGRLAVTNRHVGELFALRHGKSFPFRKTSGSTMGAKIDFREEFNVPKSKEVRVEKVLFIAPPGDNEPDVSILRLEKGALPDPIVLFDKKAKKDQAVAVIGYPASDPRNPAAALATVFGDVFEVKRLSPGFVTKPASGFVLQHDCSTLGGNSGSVVLDIDTGRAVGLHFGGRFRQANFAVTADRLKKVLKSLKVQIAVPIDVEEAPKPKALPKDAFAGRKGYDPKFLGSAASKQVPVPKLANGTGDVTKIKGTKDNLLRYTHFSVAMSASRRMCLFAAVNIDGRSSINLRRTKDKWNLDPRIDANQQFGNELYVNNDLDRGHMVRRLDPVWGKDAEAKRGNNDTFVYTNAAPQHARLNQRTWNDLEDYILSNTDAFDLKVNVFTGPVFADDDPEYRGAFLPQQFWKVVSVVNGENNKLHATAYVLSQKDLITDLEFVFGQFRTYQLPIADLEERTGLTFGKLKNFDPLRSQETFAIREIARLEDIVL